MESASAQQCSPLGPARGVPELALKAHDEAHGVGTWRNLLVAVWRIETRAPAVECASMALAELAKVHRSVALLQVVEAGASAPDAAARRALSDLLKEQRSAIRCSAVVYEGEGFRAATLRAVVTSIALLSRPPYPHVVFGSTVDAINWTAGHLSPDDPLWAENLRNAVDELRTLLDRPPG